MRHLAQAKRRKAAFVNLSILSIIPFLVADPGWAVAAQENAFEKALRQEPPDSEILIARGRGRSGYSSRGSRRSYSSGRSSRSYSSRRRGSRYDRDGDGIPCERGCGGSGYTGFSSPSPSYRRNQGTPINIRNSYGRVGGSNWPQYSSPLNLQDRSSPELRTGRASVRRYGQRATLGGRPVWWNGVNWVGVGLPGSRLAPYSTIAPRAYGQRAVLGGMPVWWNGTTWNSSDKNEEASETYSPQASTSHRRYGQNAVLRGRPVWWSGSNWVAYNSGDTESETPPIPVDLEETGYPQLQPYSGEADPIQAFMVREGYPQGRPGWIAGYNVPLCSGGPRSISNVIWVQEAFYNKRLEWASFVCAQQSRR